MKPDIIVDTSAWIDYYNKPNSKIGKAVEKIIKQEKNLIAGIILTELLQGARVQQEFDAPLDSMLAIPVLETDLNTWIETGRLAFTPTLQKPEGFRVKASEGEVVVLYFEPSATQNLKSSGFPEGGTTWQNRPNPSNLPMEVSKNLSFCYDIGNNYGP